MVIHLFEIDVPFHLIIFCCSCCAQNSDDGKSGTGKCICQPNFTGASCSSCKAGFFGFNCERCPTCVNGRCSDGRSGSGKCICNSGWEGARCDQRVNNACPAGQWGTQPNCQPCPACVAGSCNGASGECECQTGWSGTLCDRCANNYYGNDCQRCPNVCYNGFCLDGRFGSGEWYLSAFVVCRFFSIDPSIVFPISFCSYGYAGDTCSLCANGFYSFDCKRCQNCGRGTISFFSFFVLNISDY